MKGSIKILDASGHTTVEYDTEKPFGTKDAKVALKESRFATLFDAATKEKVHRMDVASTVDVDKILAEHEELIVVPIMAGGR